MDYTFSPKLQKKFNPVNKIPDSKLLHITLKQTHFSESLSFIHKDQWVLHLHSFSVIHIVFRSYTLWTVGIGQDFDCFNCSKQKDIILGLLNEYGDTQSLENENIHFLHILSRHTFKGILKMFLMCFWTSDRHSF